MKVYAISDIGKTRKVNQDSCGYHTACDGLGFFIVADGMGGHNAGEVASLATVNTFLEKAKTLREIKSEKQAADFIKGAFRRANDIILYKAAADASMAGMGTTAVAAIVTENTFIIGNIGDSRAYIISDSKIQQITEDHSYVAQLLKAGSIKEEEAKVHPKRNEITRAVGVEFYREPDIFNNEYKAGDILLLCSDGLDKMVDDSEILDIVLTEKEPEQMCTKLICAANDAGGTDNVTVLAVVL